MLSPSLRSPVPGALILAVATAFAAEPPADLVVINGSVLTLDAGSPRASAVAIKDGVFVAVGSDADIRKRVGPQTRTLDARGQSVIPGLIESHVHATGAARGEANQPFRQLHSIGEIQDWVRGRAKALPSGNWIQLPRVDVTRIRERRIPNRADLDSAAPDHPAVFTWQYANKTLQVLNSKAIAAAGITKETEVPKGGKVQLAPDGIPNGVIENASALLIKFLPSRYNPFLAMQTAITRKTEGGRIIGPQQRVTREEALRMFTLDAAWMSFDETRKGSIEVGKLADLAILTGDFLKTPETDLNKLRARITLVGGKIVHQR
ncbi:MAG: amidohydrolase family protein [Opitutaceae bacterium]